MSLIAEAWRSAEKPLDDNTKTQIKLKIEERAANCTPGFHNGLNELVKLLTKTESLEACLQLIREDLVSRASMELGNTDTHKHEQVFAAAKTKGFAVRANTLDVYIGGIQDRDIANKISDVFNQHYRPIQIIQQLQDKMKSIVREHYDYKGQESECKAGDFDAWVSFFNRFFEQHQSVDMTCHSVLVTDDTGGIKDINWNAINTKLVAVLIKDIFYLKIPGANEALQKVFNEQAIAPDIAPSVKLLLEAKLISSAEDIEAVLAATRSENKKQTLLEVTTHPYYPLRG